MKALERLLIRVTKTMDFAAGYVLLPVIFVTVVTDVTLRFVFNEPLTWGLELNEFLLFPLFVLGLPECSRTNGHIRMDLLAANVPVRLQGIFDACYSVCGIFIFYLLAKSSLDRFQFDFGLGRVSDELALPLWLPHMFMLFICGLMIVYFTLRAIANVLGFQAFSGRASLPGEG